MPAAFETCVKGGGKMVTKKLSGNRYVHGCKDEKGWHWGEVKMTKKDGFLKK